MKENWEIHWKDYYQILQVHPLAEPEVIKAAYERLARKYHPDINKEDSSVQKMKDINEAYEIISKPEKRGRYFVAYQIRITPIHVPPTTPVDKPNRESQHSTPRPNETYEFKFCKKCRDNRKVKISFIEHKPAIATCLSCSFTWDLRIQNTPYEYVKSSDLKDKPEVKQRLDEFIKNKKRFR